MRIRHWPDLVRVVCGAAAKAEIVVGRIDGQRLSGLHEYDAGDCPSSQKSLAQPIRVLEDRQVVSKVGSRNVPAVEARCSVGVTRVHGVIERVK